MNISIYMADMKYFLLFMTLAYNTALISQEKKPLDYVNPLIGTSIKGFGEGKDGGGTMPCVGPPFAMTNFVGENQLFKVATDGMDGGLWVCEPHAPGWKPSAFAQ